MRLAGTPQERMANKMSEAHIWKSYGFVMLVLILQAIVYFVAYANVPMARMVVCFLYLMFVPGIAILKLLGMKNLDTADKALFSVGLSIAFLIFMGLIINEIGILAFTNPLSLNLLLFSINTIVLLMSIAVTRCDGSIEFSLPQLKSVEWLFFILLVISLFGLGSYGTIMVNASGDSTLLLLLIASCSIAVSTAFLLKRISPKLYPWVLFAICISMLFFISGTLITRYISGTGDSWIEFYAFRLTQARGFWDSTIASSPYNPSLFPTYSMMSVTILPAVFATITGLDTSSIFQVLYPFVVAFLAFGSYKLYQTQTKNKEAFLAVFFFIIVSVGKGWGSDKQEIAELFYVLLFLLLFRKDIPSLKRNILFIIFAAGLAVSHYALTYIFLSTILVSFLILSLIGYKKTHHFSTHRTTITGTLMLILLSVTFSWYIFVNSSATFNLLSQEVNTVTSSLNQFFNPASRGTALQGLGATQNPTLLNTISSGFFYLTEFFLVFGFIVLLISKRRTKGFSTEYKVLATVNVAIIAINLLLPTIADTFLMERFYQTTLIILAPLAILGGKTILEFVLRPRFRKLAVSLLLLVVLIPFFLFQTGFVYEIAKVQSYSLPLSMYRWNTLDIYGYIVNAQEVDSAQWFPEHINVANINVYSDYVSQYNVLTGYGLIERGRIFILSNTTSLASGDFIYLANITLINQGYIFNASQIAPILENQNKLYTNGESEIYGGP